MENLLYLLIFMYLVCIFKCFSKLVSELQLDKFLCLNMNFCWSHLLILYQNVLRKDGNHLIPEDFASFIVSSVCPFSRVYCRVCKLSLKSVIVTLVQSSNRLIIYSTKSVESNSCPLYILISFIFHWLRPLNYFLSFALVNQLLFFHPL